MALGIGITAKVTGNAAAVTTVAQTTQATGSTFVVFMVWDILTSGATFVSITDSKSNVYTLVGSQGTISASNAVCRVYQCQNAVGGASHTFTGTISTADVNELFVLEITGADTSGSGLDGTPTQVHDSASPYTGTTLTTTNANDILVACFGGDSASNPATMAESTGFTIQTQETNGSTLWCACIATRIVSVAQGYTPSFTQTGATQGEIFVMAFKESAGAGDDVVVRFGPFDGTSGSGLVMAAFAASGVIAVAGGGAYFLRRRKLEAVHADDL